MELALSDDQVQILDAIDTLAKPFATVRIHDISFALTSETLDAELAEGGFLDVAAMEELGAETAALVVERLARQFGIEHGADERGSSRFDGKGQPRPLCLVEEGAVGRAVRYLKPGATVVIVGEGGVRSFAATAQYVAESQDESIFAYPMAILKALPGEADMRQYNVPAAEVLTQWRVGLAAEASGLMAAPPPRRGAGADQRRLLDDDEGRREPRSRRCRAGRAPRPGSGAAGDLRLPPVPRRHGHDPGAPAAPVDLPAQGSDQRTRRARGECRGRGGGDLGVG
jgi:hypothetical protein